MGKFIVFLYSFSAILLLAVFGAVNMPNQQGAFFYLAISSVGIVMLGVDGVLKDNKKQRCLGGD